MCLTETMCPVLSVLTPMNINLKILRLYSETFVVLYTFRKVHDLRLTVGVNEYYRDL